MSEFHFKFKTNFTHYLSKNYVPFSVMDNYLEAIEEIEEVEKVIIRDTELKKRCCTAVSDLLKAVLEYLKNLGKLMSDNHKESKEGGFHLNTDF